MSADDTVNYLLSLQAVRQRAHSVLSIAEKGSLNSFDYHADRMPTVADYVIGIIDRDFGPDRYADIPPHGRWQHHEVGGVPRVSNLLDSWRSAGCDDTELTRRLIDLFFVSVLLDAGAGDTWKFKEPGTDGVYNRSEGISVAALHMFKSGAFSADGAECVVDAKGLIQLSEETFAAGYQVTPENPLVGMSSRVKLMNTVGKSLLNQTSIVGANGRPGNMVDYLVKSSTEEGTLDYELLWRTLQSILIPSWPAGRTAVNGSPLGDAWPLKALGGDGDDAGASIQPFHKLTQWLGYSLTVPFMRILKLRIANIELGTGLPEYRNGGLFVDLGVLSLKPAVLEAGQLASKETLPKFDAGGDTIVEWRALTVALLDELYGIVSAHYSNKGFSVSMAQMLEAGTWKGGRELAAEHRPETRSSPILIDGDGTLF
ncbi:Protein of unknown function (DUF1688) [Geosmithia morbida]|uniref:DUF1688-domain-containing protein n=1 Tax=Geosmithia morbida TaxID=1094350 RepID=A0A9P4Z048_9HYPO|nr:Protein of unknown function (DUF1688) [Geosmithia morbida]KAF4126090.1 Protein of unknown function (DUF1688) [Geosmithia morbida]